MSGYYVVPLTHENYRQQYQLMCDAGEAAIRDSRNRLLAAAANDISVITKTIKSEMCLYIPAVVSDPPAQYKPYAFVVFLNEGAMQMLNEIGFDVAYVDRISKEELPQEVQLTTDHYLPRGL